MTHYDTNDDIQFLILLFILFLGTLLFVAFELAVWRPFREERRYFKLEISRTDGEERAFWKRELKLFYLRSIPVIGKILWKRRRRERR